MAGTHRLADSSSQDGSPPTGRTVKVRNRATAQRQPAGPRSGSTWAWVPAARLTGTTRVVRLKPGSPSWGNWHPARSWPVRVLGRVQAKERCRHRPGGPVRARNCSVPASWESGYPAACKAAYTGSSPVDASQYQCGSSSDGQSATLPKWMSRVRLSSPARWALRAPSRLPDRRPFPARPHT